MTCLYYDFHVVQVNEQTPTTYQKGDVVPVSVSAPSGEVIVSASALAPADWAIQRTPQVGYASGQPVFVAIDDAQVGQVASFTIDILCAKAAT